MKTVFSSASEVMHIFCQRSQSNGRSSNVFFNDNRIYSYGYHYLLAEFITNNNGDTAIMINNTGYSVTTAKHIGDITAASRQYMQFFTLNCEPLKVLNQLKTLSDKLVKAKKPELYINQANVLFDNFSDYLNWSGKQPIELTQINELIALFNSDKLKELMQVKAKELKEKVKAELIIEKQKQAEQLEKFYNYEISNIYRNYNSKLIEDFVRISADQKEVETSQGVKVPVKEAKILYQMILNNKPIHGLKIGYYTVISINGVLKIGCHNINIESMHRTGQLLLTLNNL